MNIKSILTPIDFSDNAGKIAKAAAYVAGTFQAELHLIFVVQNFEDYSGFFVPPINLPNLEEELFASAQQQMESFMEEQREMFAAAGVTEVTSKVLAGDVAEEILKYAARKKVQLIVMGTHGHGALGKLVMGSVSTQVLANCQVPVLLVR